MALITSTALTFLSSVHAREAAAKSGSHQPMTETHQPTYCHHTAGPPPGYAPEIIVAGEFTEARAESDLPRSPAGPAACCGRPFVAGAARIKDLAESGLCLITSN